MPRDALAFEIAKPRIHNREARPMDQDNNSYTDCTPEAFRQALNYLHEEALAMGWIFAAHFIAVAAEAMRAYDPNEEQQKSCIVIPFAKKDSKSGWADDEEQEWERGKW